uniref:Uncharacterized protein n=1 Tax=Arundo donax TaxID=35708 RepID=A0A0A9HDE9_ARUDO
MQKLEVKVAGRTQN